MKENLDQRPVLAGEQLSQTQVLETMPSSVTPESHLEQDKIVHELLSHIPVQEHSFALACANLGEEGLEIFEEMMGNSTIYVDNQVNVEQAKYVTDMIDALRAYQTKKLKVQFDKTELKQTRENLGLSTSQEVAMNTSIDSRELATKDEAYKINGKVEGLHYNTSHEQDAFSIREKEEITCVTVCDGVSSKKGSGELSGRLSSKISEAGTDQSLAEIFEAESLKKILKDISDEAKTIEGGGNSTIISVRIDAFKNSIEWSSVGDSPLFVVDTNEQGEPISWEIVTEQNPITHENYTNKKTLDDLKDPETYAVGIRQNGEVGIPPVEQIKRGTIEYKKGRKLVLASDFITKVLLHSPDVARAYSKFWETATVNEEGEAYSIFKKDALSKIWKKVGEQNEQEFRGLWSKNPATGEMMLNPLFILGMSASESRDLLDKWMKKNPASDDDVTIMVMELDTYFKK